MASTASQMILKALRLIGEKPVSGSLSSAEQTAYLADLNSMLESWSIDKSNCYQLVQENFALTTSQGSYTIGPSGNFDTTRPTKIIYAFTRDSNGYDTPLTIIDKQAHNAIVKKTVDGTYPEVLYYDSAYVAGLATIRIYPEPIAGLTLYIDSWKQLQNFTSISTEIALPPGYQRAIEFNLAIELAGGFRTVPAEVIKIAKDSLVAINKASPRENTLSIDCGVVGKSRGSSILTGP